MTIQQHKTAVSPARRVVVALRMAGIAGQDKLNGIFEYLATGHRWSLHILRTRHECTAETIRTEIAKGADGFIVGIPGTDDALRELAKTNRPVVLMNIDGGPLASRSQGVLSIRSDAVAVGREAASTLLSQGTCKSYGYVGYHTDEDWSIDRGNAFRAALAEAGFAVHAFDRAHVKDRAEDPSALRDWLRSLPRPCGIFAACDDRAFEIADACREAGLRIPSEIAILGVNNDPLLCENAEPQLSSIQPNFLREGFLAADTLERLMSGRREKSRTILVGVKAVVHRESTFPLSQAGRLVQKALAFIDRHALRKIGVPDVASHLKVSPSLLSLRFRELQHESVYAAITRVRLDEVKRRLRATHDPIEKISADCGWDNVNALKNLFKRREGVSMRAWRNGTCVHSLRRMASR